MVRGDVFQNGAIPLTPVIGHGQIHIQIISAVPGAGAGDLSPEVPDEPEAIQHQRQNIPGFQISRGQQIETGTAAHGAEIDDPVLPCRVVSQEGCGQMFHGVDLRGIHHRFSIWFCEPQIEGSHCLLADFVFPGDIKSRKQRNVIDGKAGDFFHNNSCSMIFSYLIIPLSGFQEGGFPVLHRFEPVFIQIWLAFSDQK